MKRKPFKRGRPQAPEAPPPGAVPASEDIEAAAIGCVFQAANDGSQGQVDAILAQLSAKMFENHWHRLAFETAAEIRAGGNHLDLTVWRAWCGEKGLKFEPHPVNYWQACSDATPTWINFPTYLGSLQEGAWRRLCAAKALEMGDMAKSSDFSPDAFKSRLSEILETSAAVGRRKGPAVAFVKASEHLKYQPRENLGLVGDSDITKGYQGVAVIAGPPGSGKSLAAVSLGIAGALGTGHWMGRPVHRQFRTLIVQCENGAGRLKKEFAAMAAAYPTTDFDPWLRISLPPEGGLPFHRPEFRRELSRMVDEFRPDVVIVDPWTAVAAEDAAKDIIEKLAEMRSCLPAGDECPALVIVAHTKKPRSEDKGNRGRALMYSVSGSQALVATARSVFVLLPYTDDIQDDRVLWACAKLSDSDTAPADSVWHRRLGTLFQHCDDDPEAFWKDPSERPAMWLTAEMLQDVLTRPARAAMTQTRLCDTLAEKFNGGRGASSVHKWLKREEFAALLSTTGGLVSWKG